MSLARGAFIQMQVAHALVMRETRTRFGAHQVGYLWALLEPLLWVATFYALFTLADRSPPSGMTVASFLVTGLVPYQLFREVTTRVVVAVEANRGLLFYPQVRPLDLVLARVVLETATWASVFAILMSAEALYVGALRIDSLLMVLSGFALCAWLGGALGMILGALSLYMRAVEKLSSALIRPLFWLSGVFYTANDVPPSFLAIIRHNPVLHCVELVRDGWFTQYSSLHVQPTYPVAVGLVLLLLGLAFERASRVRIELT